MSFEDFRERSDATHPSRLKACKTCVGNAKSSRRRILANGRDTSYQTALARVGSKKPSKKDYINERLSRSEEKGQL